MPGLSPRVRGNPYLALAAVSPTRSIPARAGEPDNIRYSHSRPPVYPRACGGTAELAPRIDFPEGLSPRVRGNRGAIRKNPIAGRSIPARAGEPGYHIGEEAHAEVYPRACGGTTPSASANSPVWGLSPRVRGNQEPVQARQINDGSIPARAGEPLGGNVQRESKRVYPRACGGTAALTPAAFWFKGLSPRVRGNPLGVDVI